MEAHYSPEEIEDGLSGRLPAAKAKEILKHLLKGCPQCRAAVRQARPSLASFKHAHIPPDQNTAYEAMLERAEDFARRAANLPPEERSRFRKALALLDSGNGVISLADKGDMRLEGLGVYEALLAKSWASRYEDPQAMCHLARAAVEVAQNLDPKTHGPWKTADHIARAWGELANSYRVADRLRKAEKAFITAFDFFQKGTRNRRLLIRLLDLEASLLGTLREFDLALERLSSLADLYRAEGELHYAGRTLITRALYLYYRGETTESYRTHQEGMKLIEKDRDPSLQLVAAFNELLYLEDCDRFKDAKIFLFKHRALLNSAGHAATIKLRWIEGRLSYGLGELESAEVSFRVVKDGFREVDLGFACALAGIDLAMTLMRLGRTDEAIQEGREATTAFVALSIHREILGSVLFLEEALRAKTATISLFEKTARYLRRKQIELGIK